MVILRRVSFMLIAIVCSEVRLYGLRELSGEKCGRRCSAMAAIAEQRPPQGYWATE